MTNGKFQWSNQQGNCLQKQLRPIFFSRCFYIYTHIEPKHQKRERNENERSEKEKGNTFRMACLAMLLHGPWAFMDVASGGMQRAGSAEWELIHTSHEKTQIQPYAPHGL